MQEITPEAQAAIEAGSQIVVPRVIAEWQNSSAVENVVASASSDDYFAKAIAMDPDTFLRIDFNRLYTDVLSDEPIGYWPLDETSGTTATDAMGISNEHMLEYIALIKHHMLRVHERPLGSMGRQDMFLLIILLDIRWGFIIVMN